MVHAMAAWTIFILYARKVYTKNETGDSGLVQARRGLFPVLSQPARMTAERFGFFLSYPCAVNQRTLSNQRLQMGSVQ